MLGIIDDSVDSGRRTVEIRNEVIEWPAHCYAQNVSDVNQSVTVAQEEAGTFQCSPLSLLLPIYWCVGYLIPCRRLD